MATKSLIRQKTGKATAPAIMSPVQSIQKTKVPLNRFKSLGISTKKVVSSASFAVAPHVISIPKKWQRSAWDTCKEIPPRKTERRINHLKFSMTKIRVVSVI
jgi:hypothetical protein